MPARARMRSPSSCARALWWFRWAAMFTFLTGLVMLYFRGISVSVDLVVGSVMAILMFLNVWLIIWPNQKILIASNEQIAGGGEALPEAAAAAPKAALASRTNVLFSIPMLYFMGSTSANLSHGIMISEVNALIGALVVIAAIEVNAIVGKPGPIASVRGVIVSGFVLVPGAVGTVDDSIGGQLPQNARERFPAGGGVGAGPASRARLARIDSCRKIRTPRAFQRHRRMPGGVLPRLPAGAAATAAAE